MGVMVRVRTGRSPLKPDRWCRADADPVRAASDHGPAGRRAAGWDPAGDHRAASCRAAMDRLATSRRASRVLDAGLGTWSSPPAPIAPRRYSASRVPGVWRSARLTVQTQKSPPGGLVVFASGSASTRTSHGLIVFQGLGLLSFGVFTPFFPSLPRNATTAALPATDASSWLP